MLITEHFVYIHTPKTAGSTVSRVLRSNLETTTGRRADGRPHPGWDQIPADARDRPVLAFVRNPWDWYVSWYLFTLRLAPDEEIFRTTFAGGENDFATTVRNACTGVVDHHNPRVQALVRSGFDFYTARFWELLGPGLDSSRLTVGRFESLEADLEAFLRRTGTPKAEEIAAGLREGPRLKESVRRHYAEYYDDDLRDLVGDRCRLFTDRFGYRFERAAAPAAP
jgi:hypothetical protein